MCLSFSLVTFAEEINDKQVLGIAFRWETDRNQLEPLQRFSGVAGGVIPLSVTWGRTNR